jgi:hypothetical protein
MPDTNGGRMLTSPEAQLANRAAVSPADRMYTQLPRRPEPPRRPTALDDLGRVWTTRVGDRTLRTAG